MVDLSALDTGGGGGGEGGHWQLWDLWSVRGVLVRAHGEGQLVAPWCVALRPNSYGGHQASMSYGASDRGNDGT